VRAAALTGCTSHPLTPDYRIATKPTKELITTKKKGFAPEPA